MIGAEKSVAAAAALAPRGAQGAGDSNPRPSHRGGAAKLRGYNLHQLTNHVISSGAPLHAAEGAKSNRAERDSLPHLGRHLVLARKAPATMSTLAAASAGRMVSAAPQTSPNARVTVFCSGDSARHRG